MQLVRQTHRISKIELLIDPHPDLLREAAKRRVVGGVLEHLRATLFNDLRVTDSGLIAGDPSIAYEVESRTMVMSQQEYFKVMETQANQAVAMVLGCTEKKAAELIKNSADICVGSSSYTQALNDQIAKLTWIKRITEGKFKKKE